MGNSGFRGVCLEGKKKAKVRWLSERIKIRWSNLGLAKKDKQLTKGLPARKAQPACSRQGSCILFLAKSRNKLDHLILAQILKAKKMGEGKINIGPSTS